MTASSNLQVADSAYSVGAFVDRLIDECHAYDGPERRTEIRRALAVPIVAQPLSDDLEPLGEPLRAVTRDIAGSGISLFYTEPIRTNFLGLQLVSPSGEEMHIVATMVRCRPYGVFFEMGCQFVAKWNVTDDARTATFGIWP